MSGFFVEESRQSLISSKKFLRNIPKRAAFGKSLLKLRSNANSEYFLDISNIESQASRKGQKYLIYIFYILFPSIANVFVVLNITSEVSTGALACSFRKIATKSPDQHLYAPLCWTLNFTNAVSTHRQALNKQNKQPVERERAFRARSGNHVTKSLRQLFRPRDGMTISVQRHSPQG